MTHTQKDERVILNGDWMPRVELEDGANGYVPERRVILVNRPGQQHFPWLTFIECIEEGQAVRHFEHGFADQTLAMDSFHERCRQLAAGSVCEV